MLLALLSLDWEEHCNEMTAIKFTSFSQIFNTRIFYYFNVSECATYDTVKSCHNTLKEGTNKPFPNFCSTIVINPFVAALPRKSLIFFASVWNGEQVSNIPGHRSCTLLFLHHTARRMRVHISARLSKLLNGVLLLGRLLKLNTVYFPFQSWLSTCVLGYKNNCILDMLWKVRTSVEHVTMCFLLGLRSSYRHYIYLCLNFVFVLTLLRTSLYTVAIAGIFWKLNLFYWD